MNLTVYTKSAPRAHPRTAGADAHPTPRPARWQGALTAIAVFGFMTLGVVAHAHAQGGRTSWLASTVLPAILLAAFTAGTCVRVVLRFIIIRRHSDRMTDDMNRLRALSSIGNWCAIGALFIAVGGYLASEPVPVVTIVVTATATTTAIGYHHDHMKMRESSEQHRVQQLFCRYVGEEVAERAMRQDTALTGQEMQVAVLFVDLADSTALASCTPPSDVARLLNEFFLVVVETVDRYGGFVNKFEGDAALAIFGAPRELGDSAGAALGAARHLRDSLLGQLPAGGFGIGVSAGCAFAGQVGAPTRSEYTVIGDPVNEAARLTELAKGEAGHVLASATAVSGAGQAEAASWDLGEEVALRGRSAPTLLARPVAAVCGFGME